MNMAVASGGPDGTTEFLLIAIAGIILVLSWIVLAGSRFVQGGVVERPERVPQLYGYTMCLVAVLVSLASLISVVEHTLTLADPAQVSSDWSGWIEPSVTSFEAFRMTYERSQQMGGGMPPMRSLSEEELKRRYEALREDRISTNRAAATRGLITGLITLALGAGLFVFHWRWLRRRVDVRSEAGPVAG